MKAAYIETTGGPDVIRYGDLPTPDPQAGEVRVRVAAASLNPVDTYIRAGIVAMPLPERFIPGCDLAGTVEAVGPGVTRFKVGDRVWGSNQGLLGRQGTFAECCVTGEQWLYPVPNGVTEADAAASRSSASPPTWGCSGGRSCSPVRRCSSTAARAGWGRAWCRWRRRRGRR